MNKVLVDRKLGNYITLNKSAFTDKELSLKARGLLATIMTLPDDWDFSVNGLCQILKEGETAIRTSIKELMDNGYCTRFMMKENGKIYETQYTFYERRIKGDEIWDKTQDYIDSYLIHRYDFSQYDTDEIRKALLKDDIDYGQIKYLLSECSYKEFLGTPYWQGVSLIVRDRAKYKCELCGNKGRLNVHHKTYENHGDEIHHLDDLICLCEDCHHKFHEKLAD